MLYKIIATIVLLLFYGCYFLKMLLQKHKGIQTDQMGKGKAGFAKLIETAMKTASISVLITEVISIFFLPVRVDAEWVRIAGILFALSGTVVFICSVITMKDNWRAGVSETDKTELVTGGIYQISRNPAFLGFDLVYLGILCMFFNWLLFIISIFAVVMFHLQISNVEEDFLTMAFGDDYIKYKSKVCRYLGRKR